MSEAIIARKLKNVDKVIDNTKYIDNTAEFNSGKIPPLVGQTTLFVVPSNLVTNTLLVTLSGAKGADNDSDTGSYGELITEEVTVTPGETIPIYIGEEGTDGNNGEPTSFGTYLVANGGLSANNKVGIEESSNHNTGGAGFALIRYATSNEEAESDE